MQDPPPPPSPDDNDDDSIDPFFTSSHFGNIYIEIIVMCILQVISVINLIPR